ncbi:MULTISPECIES: SPFH domain-containing protein [unclassified Streptomyces]|uniref:SPFH domain-containing protein n=1 Tax=unclassified Streptomyces TaxID=2593676 RepID=UPI001F5B5D22|nr:MULTISPECIES: SPFH domain-containing protein [unclassified Streptomyces]
MRPVGALPRTVPHSSAAPGGEPSAAPAPEPPEATGPAGRGAPAAPDFARIAGAGVGAVAVPVAAVVRVARRKNVIGAETTGSIPVHLLFRDEPEGAAPFAVGEDDGGPDTVSMAPPVAPATARKAGGPAIPAPSKVQGQAEPAAGTKAEPAKGLAPDAARRATAAPHPKAQAADTQSKPHPKVRPQSQPHPQTEPQHKQQPKPQPKPQPQPHPEQQPQPPARPRGGPARSKTPAPLSRPAPTADPGLVERPGPVLPGWVGVAGGALALAWCAGVVWWTGAVPEEAARMLRLPVRPYHGIHLGQWALLALGVVLATFALGGLGRGRVGYAWVLTLFGDYRGTVRRTGLVWVSPLLLRRRVDVRLRHWRSEPLPAVDAKGTALDVVVLVVWRVRDTVRAALGVDGHEEYLREQVEAAMARVLSQLPADAFHEDAPTLRDAEAVGEALTRMLSAECVPVGVDVFSAQPTRIEYAPEVAAAMRRRRIAAIDAKHRDSVLTSVVDAVDDVVHRLTSRGLVELDDYERKALVKDLTVAFYTGRTGPVEGA